MNPRGRVFAFALASFLGSSIATAQPPPSDTAKSDAKPDTKTETKLHFQRGVKLYSEEDYRAALVEFKRAYEISQNPAILYNVGQTQFQLRDYVAALQSFERYLGTAGSQLTAARRQQVDKDIEDLRGRIAKVTIETNIPGAEIMLDDVSLGVTPLPGPIDVSAGQRRLSATKEGYVTSSRSFELAGGDATTVRLDLVPIPIDAPREASSTSTPQKSPVIRGTHPLVFIGYGVAVAGLATGTVAGILALGTKNDLDARCPSGVCPSSERGTGDTLTLQATISTIGFGAAVLGAGVGTYFLLAKSGASKSAARVSPWFAGTSAGLSGAF